MAYISDSRATGLDMTEISKTPVTMLRLFRCGAVL